MNGQLLQSNCPPAPPARWASGISAATLVAMSVAITVAALAASAADRAPAASADATTAAFTRIADIPSHNGTYRASLVPSSNSASRFDSEVWTVKVETVSGAPVNDATLTLQGWMPDDEAMRAAPPRVTRNLGDGSYRVEGLRFDRRGWWNVRVMIAAAGATDSLAFNLVR